ncbi:hypothetical protein NQZ68_025674 [Dissostichus eleginoides]|nr:hypothetical protein NQZ68_025674 [Dissostichus eleginoides]
MPDGLRLGHNIGGMRFCRSQGVELESERELPTKQRGEKEERESERGETGGQAAHLSLFTAAAATLSQRTGPFHARWKTDLSLLDPIPASHSPLAGSEAAVPGEKRGPGKAQSLGGPAYKDSHKPQDLLEKGGGDRESGRKTEGTEAERGAGSMALIVLSLWVLTSLTWADVIPVPANRHSVYWNSSNIQ